MNDRKYKASELVRRVQKLPEDINSQFEDIVSRFTVSNSGVLERVKHAREKLLYCSMKVIDSKDTKRAIELEFRFGIIYSAKMIQVTECGSFAVVESRTVLNDMVDMRRERKEEKE